MDKRLDVRRAQLTLGTDADQLRVGLVIHWLGLPASADRLQQPDGAVVACDVPFSSDHAQRARGQLFGQCGGVKTTLRGEGDAVEQAIGMAAGVCAAARRLCYGTQNGVQEYGAESGFVWIN